MSGNLFDCSILNDYYLQPYAASDLSKGVSKVYQYSWAKSQLVPIDGIGTYMYSAPYKSFGNNSKLVATFDRFKNFIEYIEADMYDKDAGLISSPSEIVSIVYGVIEITNENVAYINYNININSAIGYPGVKYAMFLKTTQWPEEYIPYNFTCNNINSTINGISLNRFLSTIDYVPKSINLLNPNQKFNHGYTNNGELKNPNSTEHIYTFVPITSEGYYTYAAYPFTFGLYTNDRLFKEPVLDSSIESISITPEFLTDQRDANNNLLTKGVKRVNITQSLLNNGYKYFLFQASSTYYEQYQDMFIYGDSYPEEYINFSIEHFNSEVNTISINNVNGYEDDINKRISLLDLNSHNILYGKTIVFDGDSICHASSDTLTHTNNKKWGWAGRIGEKNNMDWYNYAVGGGTLVTGLYYSSNNPRHWVSEYIDTIYSLHSNLDYYIFEGGTNDADLLGLNSDKYGVLNLGDYTSGIYDTTKFYNAMDYICYKATKYWPHAKIGYIVAMKMGIGYTDFTATNSKRRFYFEMAIEACEKWGIPYLDLWQHHPMNPKIPEHFAGSTITYDSQAAQEQLYIDGQHPSYAGYNLLTPTIESWIRSL